MSLQYSSLAKPRGTWWRPIGRDEKLWVGFVAIWCLSMFAMIVFIWPAIGTRQNDIVSYRVDPADFHARVESFTAANKVGELAGIPVVAPPPGSDVYLEAQAFQWRPIIQLKRGQTYRFMMSSRDLQHGFSLLMEPRSLNYQLLPGYVTSVSLTPLKSGDYPLACNEYCGLGHHLMLGRIIVTD
ncbi:MAG: cytochrome c oxidase subunit II [Chloroflexi bacterium]|nr:cytochrome c oxidase subunit II [Chloroflexota bacterium]